MAKFCGSIEALDILLAAAPMTKYGDDNRNRCPKLSQQSTPDIINSKVIDRVRESKRMKTKKKKKKKKKKKNKKKTTKFVFLAF